ncbi:MAG: hypothetical protein HQM09_19455 [Candidatus Riflebacteria bacterium]|nr:hypothetical protein [Candidatus Riflebacteria bacterium]
MSLTRSFGISSELLDKIELYLPKFLSPEDTRQLLDDLGGFPNNIDKSRFYTTALRDDPTIFQGDGLLGLLMVHLPQPEIRSIPSMVISNTCDVDPANKRFWPSSISYAPIFRVNKFRESIMKVLDGEKAADSLLCDLRRQRITQLFYLPKGGSLEEESFVRLDHIVSCSNDAVSREDIPAKRLFTLSNYGVWLFALKLSIHFCRLTDKVSRPNDLPTHTGGLE